MMIIYIGILLESNNMCMRKESITEIRLCIWITIFYKFPSRQLLRVIASSCKRPDTPIDCRVYSLLYFLSTP